MFRPFLLLCAGSVLLFLVLLVAGYNPDNGEYRSGYALLTLDSSVNDRDVVGLLAGENGKFRGPLYSESSQWVMLDEFGSLARIPLDEYGERLYPFDPRNDGYAEKLKNFFVYNGDRFIFIPMQPYNSAALFRDFDSVLPGIPYSIDYLGFGRSVKLYFILFFVSVVLLFILCRLQKKARLPFVFFIPSIFVLAVYSYYGPWGFTLAAIAIALSAQLREPVFEICAVLRAKNIENKEKPGRIKRDVLKPNLVIFLETPFFILAVGLIIHYTGLRGWFVSVVFLLHLLVFALSCWSLSFSGVEHRRFRPLLIVKRRFPDMSFSLYMIPFAIAAVFSIFISPGIPAQYSSNTSLLLSSFAERTVTADDYQKHIDFQASFSLRSLNGGNSLYASYFIDDDGLLSPAGGTGEKINEDFPSFPLQRLMDFVTGLDAPVSDSVFQKEEYEYMALPVLFIFIIPALILKNSAFSPKRKRISVLSKSYNTVGRWGDKKRKNVLLFTSNSSKMIRKDA
jgi:hypothetical protein